MCKSRTQAEAALARLRVLLADLALEPKEAKTRIMHLEVGGEGLTFLGFAHHMVRSPAGTGKRPITFLARWPADKAMQHARDRLRELTDRSRFRVPVEAVVQEMNWFLNGWAGYFRYGNSARRFAQLQWYAQMRLGLFLSKRYGRAPVRPVAGRRSRSRPAALGQLCWNRRRAQAEQVLAGEVESRR